MTQPSRTVDPIGEWTVAELKAELKELDLSIGGNKQELYERLLDHSDYERDEEDWDDDDNYEDWDERTQIDFTAIGLTTVRTLVRLRIPILSVLIAGLLVTAAAAGLPKLFEKKEVAEPEIHVWQFTVNDHEQTDIQSYFIEDDTTERVVMTLSFPMNISSVYIGAYFQESDEQPGGIIGCDKVTMELLLTDVNKTNLYSLSSTDATSQNCDADETEPWDQIWYQYDLDLPNATNFEGTEEEALALWDAYTGTGTGEWNIDISVDVYTLWGPACDCEDGEDVRLTLKYTEYEVSMEIVQPEEN